MAKDPAFLFYPGDYVSGTMHLDFECKGAYIDLLMLQFQKDHMTLHMIKQVLGHRFEHIWSLISDKFQHKDGKYWNERLRVEKEKRVNFCKSRKSNRNSTKHMSQHMSQHMENENENINEDINTGGVGDFKNEKKNDMAKPKDSNPIPLPFPEKDFSDAWAEWLQYRKERRLAAYTPTGLKRTFKKLLADSGNDCKIAIQMIDNAIANSWQGIHPLKNSFNATSSGLAKNKPTTGNVSSGGFGQL